MNDREHFDILLVVPLEEELKKILEIFPGLENRSTTTDFRYVVDGGAPGIRILAVQSEGMGKSHASRVVSQSFAEFDIGLVICLGIAGSLTDDLQLGDVAYSEAVIDVYDNSKALENDTGELDIALSPTYYNSPRELTASFNFMRTFPELRTAYENWQAEQGQYARSLVKKPVPGRGGSTEELGSPSSKNGTIVCAAISKSDKYNSKLRAIDRKVLAIETESGGVFDEARSHHIPAITIRGISDHADSAKNVLETATRGQVRTIAAANAASFLRLQLANDPFQSYLARRRGSPELALALPGVAALTATRNLTSIIADIGASIDEKLRELSPEFRLQQKGYRLPVPRMREIHCAAGMYTFKSDPMEITDALESRDVILLSLSRNYPDYSLPWVIANTLLRTRCETIESE